jgi:hypothetical protein
MMSAITNVMVTNPITHQGMSNTFIHVVYNVYDVSSNDISSLSVVVIPITTSRHE